MNTNNLSRRHFLSMLAVQAQAGCLLSGDPTQSVADRATSLVNVKNAPYHAMGDGITDDRAAIQQALDDAQAAAGGIFLPPGIYLLGGSLLLRDGVSIYGLNADVSIFKLANGTNAPVITDSGITTAKAYSFGRIRLQDFGIDGNAENNPKAGDGIFTSAYFSTLQNLSIHACKGHGIHVGTNTLLNNASQNNIVGCRIDDCGGAGVFLDIHGVDHIISRNYIFGCDIGVMLNNGGSHVIGNVIFGNRSAGIFVGQTPFNVLINSNDLNANKRRAIHITRTDKTSTAAWGQILVSGNTICGDELEADATYDGIFVDTDASDGIDGVTIVGNKIFTFDQQHRFRYGINLNNNVTHAWCAANHVEGWASARYHVSANCKQIEIDSIGGGVVSPPTIPASGKPLVNPYPVAVSVYLSGSAVRAVDINGTHTGIVNGSFRLLANQSITLTYDKRPSWTWFAD